MVRAESDLKVAGIGFVLGDGFVGFDADECLDGNRMPTNDFAGDVLTLGTYTEVSPSGSGFKAILRGTIRESHNRGREAGLPKREVYDGRQGSARFFTITVSATVTRPRFAEIYRSRLTEFMIKFPSLRKGAKGSAGSAEASAPRRLQRYYKRAVGWRHSRFAARSEEQEEV